MYNFTVDKTFRGWHLHSRTAINLYLAGVTRENEDYMCSGVHSRILAPSSSFTDSISGDVVFTFALYDFARRMEDDRNFIELVRAALCVRT